MYWGLELLSELDENCTDDGENSDSVFIVLENEISDKMYDSSEEQMLNIPRNKSLLLLPSDGTQWKMLDEIGFISDRYISGNVLKEKIGSTSHAEKIIGGNQV